MDRRAFIAGAITAGLVPHAASAANVCYPNGTCEAGIPNIAVTPAQQCPQWCWAACIEAIFGLHNRPVGQQAIVSRLFGSTPCVPAQSQQVFAAINGAWLDAYGRPFQARAEVIWDSQAGIAHPNSRSIIVNDLINGFPLINGAVGHATVVTSVQYAPTFPEPTILGVVVRDPWPWNPNRRALSPQEIAGTGFMARVRVS